MGIFNWIKKNEDVSLSLSSHIKNLIKVMGIIPPESPAPLSSIGDFLQHECARGGYGYYYIGDYQVYFHVASYREDYENKYKVTRLFISHCSDLYSKLYEWEDTENLVECIYLHLKGEENKKEEEKRLILDEKIKLLILKDNEKYLNQKKFDEMKQVFIDRKRLSEITKEAISIHKKYSLINI